MGIVNKHIFEYPKESPMPKLAPSWVGYTCKFCGKRSGLDAWQIKDMPPDMAECGKSPVRMGIFERFFGSVNCFKE